jgi:hypothetical protein
MNATRESRIRTAREEPALKLSDKAKIKLAEMTLKLEADILLRDSHKRIHVPTYEEWVGVGLLERDDGLKRTKGTSHVPQGLSRVEKRNRNHHALLRCRGWCLD